MDINNGLIINWGTTPTLKGDTWYGITLPHAYSIKVFVAFGIPGWPNSVSASTGLTWNTSTDFTSLTQIGLGLRGATSAWTMYWCSIGY